MQFIIDDTTYRTDNYWSPATIASYGGGHRALDTISVHVWHTSMGHMASDIPTLTNNTGQGGGHLVSAHFYIPRTAQGGRNVIYCLVDPINAAWQAYTTPANRRPGGWRRYMDPLNENYLSVGTEQEALSGEPLTAYQHEAAAWLQAYLWRLCPAMKQDRDHVVGHYEISAAKQDPQASQGWNWDSFWAKALAYYAAGGGGAPPPVPTPVPNHQTAIETFHDTSGGLAEYGNPLEVDGAGRVKERTIPLPDVLGAPFQVAFYQKGVIVWRQDLGASRYNCGAWLLDSLIKLGEI